MIPSMPEVRRLGICRAPTPAIQHRWLVSILNPALAFFAFIPCEIQSSDPARITLILRKLDLLEYEDLKHPAMGARNEISPLIAHPPFPHYRSLGNSRG